jgi:hypothetical protein
MKNMQYIVRLSKLQVLIATNLWGEIDLPHGNYQNVTL